jgi:Glycosyltransferase family 17
MKECLVKLYDTFLFGSGPQDLDLLECRLYELGDHDPFHAHVIVEGACTFTGLPKPLYFMENRSRFAPWLDKIRYFPIMPSTSVAGKQPGEAWAREHASRQACGLGLWDAEPDDLVIHGDVDEILTNEAIAEIAAPPVAGYAPWPYKLKLRHFSFAVDWEQPQLWHAPSVGRFGEIASFTDLREGPWPALDLSSLPPDPAGWHLSWLGGPDAMEVKVHSFSHAEQVKDVTAGIRDGRWLEQGRFWPGAQGHESEYQLLARDVDGSWPRWVVERKCPESWFRPRS